MLQNNLIKWSSLALCLFALAFGIFMACESDMYTDNVKSERAPSPSTVNYSVQPSADRYYKTSPDTETAVAPERLFGLNEKAEDVSGGADGNVDFGRSRESLQQNKQPLKRGTITKAQVDKLRARLKESEEKKTDLSTNLRLSRAQSLTLAKRFIQSAPSGSLPSEDEEVWIIVKPRKDIKPTNKDDAPGTGGLVAKLPDNTKTVPVPLKHTDVKAQIDGYISSVNVKQQFHNPYEQKIEAVYVFPLPQNAAINEFVMTIGDRKIRGIIRDRAEAEKIYNDAKNAGRTASLLTQERPNIFTQKVANIDPGKQIDIDITYFNTLAYKDGWYEFVFPMVVGPRFNPPNHDNGVGAVAHGHKGVSGQPTEVEYLRPEQRSGHDISLALTMNPGVTVEEFKSVNHNIEKIQADDGTTTISLARGESIPNKDFVLRYRVAGDQIKSGLMTYRDENGQGYFALTLYPPQYLNALERQPLELIFVLDCSGSMSGRPMAQAKKAMDTALSQLGPQDTFQIIRFSNNASQLGNAPILATPENITKARRYVQQLHGSGGTMMIEGIKAALDFPHDENRLRFVAFMTDGYIGNEAQILSEMKQRLGASRIFSFGVGSSPNRFLLNRMATLGNGAVAYMPLNHDAGQVMDAYFKRISHPALANIKIDWGQMQVTDVYPPRTPDLFVGRPVTIMGKFKGDGLNTLRINGRAGNNDIEVGMRLNLSNEKTTHKALPAVWARQKIAHLMNTGLYDPIDNLPEQIRKTALDYSLMSQFTAFVAVDSKSKTSPGTGATVKVPVPVPDGVNFDKTVGE